MFRPLQGTLSPFHYAVSGDEPIPAFKGDMEMLLIALLEITTRQGVLFSVL